MEGSVPEPESSDFTGVGQCILRSMSVSNLASKRLRLEYPVRTFSCPEFCEEEEYKEIPRILSSDVEAELLVSGIRNSSITKIPPDPDAIKIPQEIDDSLWIPASKRLPKESVCTLATLCIAPNKRTCVTSYGVITYSVVNKTRMYFLGLPRHTPEYCTIIRGRCPYNKLEYFISHLSDTERFFLSHFPHEVLWNDCYANDDDSLEEHPKRNTNAKEHFDRYREDMIKMIETSPRIRTEAEWGFFKGRYSHTDINTQDTAVREWEEECSLDFKSAKAKIRRDISCIVENFLGTDRKEYRTIYYIAEMPTPIIPTKIHIKGMLTERTVTGEMADAIWVNYHEALNSLNERRRYMLRMVDYMISHS